MTKPAPRKAPRRTGSTNGAPGPGAETQFESPGTLEPATLETTGGKKIACGNSKQFGEFLTAKTAETEISLYECKEAASGEPCQSLRPEESPPTPEEGTIISNPAEAELGLVSGGSKPKVGWDYKAKTGSALFQFECGKTTGLGTKVTIEGSFIGVVSKIVNRMGEEDKLRYTAPGGKQSPAQFEGGSPDVLTRHLPDARACSRAANRSATVARKNSRSPNRWRSKPRRRS